ncbi:MAG: MFS transporter [Geminocystis sp.]|nr:MFS transporter [Geminocystis sp.]MCS7147343.1 MFS transporter [Geminocystis sp.]MDW8116342.1 MFS transporter [Geminocystis sp.]MDW8462669.1 MFS transporter [Geminocystis sp.]
MKMPTDSLEKKEEYDKLLREGPKETDNEIMNVIKNANFLLLWLGQVFSQLADKIYLVLMIGIIKTYFQQPGESISGKVSMVMIAFTIPAILFGSLAGVYVDRWSKKMVLVTSNLGRGLLVLIIPLCLSWQTTHLKLFSLPWGFWLTLLVTFCVSTLTQFFAPAEQATIPLIVRRKDLLAANSIYTTTMMGMLIVGFAIGQPLLTMADTLPLPHGRELLVGGCYLTAGGILTLLYFRETKKHLQTSEIHPWQDIKEGIEYLKANPIVRYAIIQQILLFSLFAALAVLAVPMAEKIPGMRAEEFGYLLAATGVGVAMGAAFVTQQGKLIPYSRLSFWGFVGMGGSLLVLPVVMNSLVSTLIITVVLGFSASFVGVPMQTTIQVETPPNKRGKVFGLQNNAVNIALSLPLALAGVAETYFGLRWVLLFLACLATSGVTFSIMVPDSR